MTSKSLKLFTFKLDVHDYDPERSIPVQNFILICSAEASPQRGEMLRLILFPGYTVFYSWACTQVEPVDGFSQFMAHTTYFCPRMVPLGIATISEFI